APGGPQPPEEPLPRRRTGAKHVVVIAEPPRRQPTVTAARQRLARGAVSQVADPPATERGTGVVKRAEHARAGVEDVVQHPGRAAARQRRLRSDHVAAVGPAAEQGHRMRVRPDHAQHFYRGPVPPEPPAQQAGNLPTVHRCLCPTYRKDNRPGPLLALAARTRTQFRWAARAQGCSGDRSHHPLTNPGPCYPKPSRDLRVRAASPPASSAIASAAGTSRSARSAARIRRTAASPEPAPGRPAAPCRRSSRAAAASSNASS